MTYQAFEQSARAGRPIELFEFVQGATTWRYAAYDADYTWNSQPWQAVTIGRGSIQQSGKMDQAGIELRLPRSNAFAQSFLSGLVEAVTSVTVRRGHVGDPDAEFFVSWKGRVLGASADGAEIVVNCESIFTSLRRQGLRRVWQRGCPHVLYGRGCGLTQANYSEGPFAAASVSGLVVTVAEAALQADGWFTGGLLEGAASVRFVMAHAGTQLSLSRAHPLLAEQVAASGYGLNYGNDYGGIPVTLYPGCDRTVATCESKFNNLLNHGGWPYIPTKNPMGGSSIV